MKRRTSVKAVFNILGSIFFGIGLFVVFVGIITTVSDKRFIKNAEKTEAIITDIHTETTRGGGKRRTHHEVNIEYVVDGVLYNGHLNEYTSSMHEGMTITIYYDPDDPYDVRTGSMIAPIILFGIGSLFAIIGGTFLAVNITKSLKRRKLMATGEPLTGTIIDVKMNMSVRINYMHPYKAECEVINPYNGERYLYSSDNIMEDITGLVGKNVTVYVDRNDPKKYFVDIFELKKRYMEENHIHDYR